MNRGGESREERAMSREPSGESIVHTVCLAKVVFFKMLIVMAKK